MTVGPRDRCGDPRLKPRVRPPHSPNKAGHGAALVGKRLPGVVGYVHDGAAPCEADHATPGKFFELMSRFAPVATWLAGGALIGLGWLSVAMLGPLVGLGTMAGMLVATYLALEVA
ncbi:hypothetical protein [Nocardia sp. CA-120079]|uniref:hypothetical protein n=1 Tax=Nocardia sp. CA-120079 TaxID=3239974 RepID=UPI003D98BB94